MKNLCRWCHTEFTARRVSVVYCSPECGTLHRALLRDLAALPIRYAKRAARIRLRDAIKLGNVMRGACEVCGTRKAVEGHHEDYSKPLEVRWLCRAHHMEQHTKANESNRNRTAILATTAHAANIERAAKSLIHQYLTQR